MRHDWPFKDAIVHLPIRLKRNWKRTSGKTLIPLWAQNKDFGGVSQTLPGIASQKYEKIKSASLNLRNSA